VEEDWIVQDDVLTIDLALLGRQTKERMKRLTAARELVGRIRARSGGGLVGVQRAIRQSRI
jgi:hypothetical protein